MREIKAGRLSMLAALEAHKKMGMEGIPSPELARPISVAWGEWLGQFRVGNDISEVHADDLARRLRQLTTRKVPAEYDPTRLELDEVATANNLARPVIELPKLLAEYRDYTLGITTFNRVRAACQAFARDNGGRQSLLWKEITNTRRYKERPLSQRKRYPLEVSELVKLAEASDDDSARAVLSMALTGMGITEYWGFWEDSPQLIYVHGEKRKGRDRPILRLVKPWQPDNFTADAFRRRLTKIANTSGLPVRPYDLRRTFARLLENAGVVRSNCSAYMGHGPKSLFDLYAHGDAIRFIGADAERVRAHLAPLTPILERLGLNPE
ncbi:MAG: hypothetical protein WKF55_03575 [Gemmatimonadaceae bacterium]